MPAKYQIFVSSTYDDLRAERERIIRAVLEMGHIPVGMEMFSAGDEEQWQIIKNHIDESDYYVVLIAHRYGSLSGNTSFTRKEYEYALAIGVPILGFVIDPTAYWAADRIDKGEPAQLLNDFRSLVEKKPVGYWKNVDDLHGKVSIALSKAFASQPRDGWVRASDSVGPALTVELTRLSSENARLRTRLDAAERETAAEKEREFEELRTALRGQKRKIGYRYVGERTWRSDAKPWTLSEVFVGIAPMLIPEYTVIDSAKMLALSIARDQKKHTDTVPLNSMKELLTELMAFELVEPSQKKHSLKDNAEYWSLTPKGIEYLRWINFRYFDSTVKSQRAQAEKRQALSRRNVDAQTSADTPQTE